MLYSLEKEKGKKREKHFLLQILPHWFCHQTKVRKNRVENKERKRKTTTSNIYLMKNENHYLLTYDTYATWLSGGRKLTTKYCLFFNIRRSRLLVDILGRSEQVVFRKRLRKLLTAVYYTATYEMSLAGYYNFHSRHLSRVESHEFLLLQRLALTCFLIFNPTNLFQRLQCS